MKKVTFMAVAAIIAFPLFANTPSDTTIVLGNKKIEIIDEENRLRVRVFDLIEYGEHVERQLAFEGHYRGGVRHERRHVLGTISVPVPAATQPRRETERRDTLFHIGWSGIGIGFNHFGSDDISLNAMRSLEYTLNMHDIALPFSRNFGLVTGWGLTWNRYHLNNNMFFANVNGITEVLSAEGGINLTKSRLGINSLTVPLLLEWQIRTQHNRRNFLYLSAGVIGNVNYMSRAKVHFNSLEGQRVRETIRGRDLNVRPFTVDWMAQIGVREWFAVYAKYRPMGLFERDRGPVITPISVGLKGHF